MPLESAPHIIHGNWGNERTIWTKPRFVRLGTSRVGIWRVQVTFSSVQVQLYWMLLGWKGKTCPPQCPPPNFCLTIYPRAWSWNNCEFGVVSCFLFLSYWVIVVVSVGVSPSHAPTEQQPSFRIPPCSGRKPSTWQPQDLLVLHHLLWTVTIPTWDLFNQNSHWKVSLSNSNQSQALFMYVLIRPTFTMTKVYKSQVNHRYF